MRTALVSLALISLTACGFAVGNGTSTTTMREVGAFPKIYVQDAINLVAKPGERSVTVTADENFQDLIEVINNGDALIVRAKNHTQLSPSVSNPILVVVTNDQIERIDASGASDVKATVTPVTELTINASGSSTLTIDGISSSTVSVDASGSSDVTLSGEAVSATFVGSGGADLTATALPLQSAAIALSGASTLHAKVSDSISGSASGASDVFIVGDPASTVSLSGSSTLKKNQ